MATTHTHTHTLYYHLLHQAHLLWPVYVRWCLDLWEKAKTTWMDRSYCERVTLTTANTDNWHKKLTQIHAYSKINNKTPTQAHKPWEEPLDLTHSEPIFFHSQCRVFASSLCDSWSWGSVLCDWTTSKWSVQIGLLWDYEKRCFTLYLTLHHCLVKKAQSTGLSRVMISNSDSILWGTRRLHKDSSKQASLFDVLHRVQRQNGPNM